MGGILLLGALLLGFWAALSGQTTPHLVAEGVIGCVAVAWGMGRLGLWPLGWSVAAQLRGVITYLPWLLWQVVVSNLRVIRLVWDPRLPISPCMVQLPCTLKTELGRVVYANSITLTPGTVTVLLDDGGLLVHALTASDAEGLKDGAMEGRVARLEQAA